MTGPSTPAPILKPTLAMWMFQRGISAQAAAEVLDCSVQTIRNLTKPFDDVERTVPRQDLLEKIVLWTDGAVTAADFYPPHLRARTHAAASIGALPEAGR
jgi:hypothetical protein